MPPKTNDKSAGDGAFLAPSKVIELDPAIEWSGGTVSHIELREPLVAEYLKAQQEVSAGGTTDQYTRFQMSLISSVSGRPRAVVEKLTVRKLKECWAYISPFLEDTPDLQM